MFQKILLGLDDSESGQLAISFATALARGRSASVHVFHVNRFVMGGRGHKIATNEEVKVLLTDAVIQLRSAGIQASGSAVSATSMDVGTRIADAATNVQADLIVLGSHRRRGLSRLSSGGVREQVTRETWLPVMTAPAPLGRISRAQKKATAESLERLPRSISS